MSEWEVEDSYLEHTRMDWMMSTSRRSSSYIWPRGQARSHMAQSWCLDVHVTSLACCRVSSCCSLTSATPTPYRVTCHGTSTPLPCSCSAIYVAIHLRCLLFWLVLVKQSRNVLSRFLRQGGVHFTKQLANCRVRNKENNKEMKRSSHSLADLLIKEWKKQGDLLIYFIYVLFWIY